MNTITEVRHTPLGTFTIVHEVKPHKAWRVPKLQGGKNKAGGAKCYAPKIDARNRAIPHPPCNLPEGQKFMKALKLRKELIRVTDKAQAKRNKARYRGESDNY